MHRRELRNLVPDGYSEWLDRASAAQPRPLRAMPLNCQVDIVVRQGGITSEDRHRGGADDSP